MKYFYYGQPNLIMGTGSFHPYFALIAQSEVRSEPTIHWKLILFQLIIWPRLFDHIYLIVLFELAQNGLSKNHYRRQGFFDTWGPEISQSTWMVWIFYLYSIFIRAWSMGFITLYFCIQYAVHVAQWLGPVARWSSVQIPGVT